MYEVEGDKVCRPSKLSTLTIRIQALTSWLICKRLSEIFLSAQLSHTISNCIYICFLFSFTSPSISISISPTRTTLFAPICLYHQSPCAFIAAATFEKPAILLPATRLGNSPSAGSTYSFAVSNPFLKHDSMMFFSLLSTSSEVQAMR